MPARLDKYINVHDFRNQARRLLPSPVLGYLEGGADDEYRKRFSGRHPLVYDLSEPLTCGYVPIVQIDFKIEGSLQDIK